jgi:hypothetical protein
MRAIAAVLVALAACYNPSFDEPRCSAQGACPDRLECRGGFCVRPGVPGMVPDGPLVDAEAAPIDADVDAAEVSIDAAVDALIPPDAIDCPVSYSDIGVAGSRYRIVTSADGWLAAEVDCENDGSATHLVVIDGATELAMLDPVVAATVWVGISDRIDEGMFLAVTGGTPPFQPWRAGEPNDGIFMPSDCVELDGFEYNDEACGTNRGYVCECDGRPADPSTYTP